MATVLPSNGSGKTRKVSYTYDNVGNLAVVIDPKKTASSDPDDFTTAYTYNLNHQVIKVTDAKGNTISYEYDLDGLKTAVTDPKKTASDLHRAEPGRDTQGIHGGSLTSATSYAYGPNGNPLSREHGDRSASYEYSPRDLVAKVTTTTPDVGTQVSTYDYTPHGQRAHVVKGNDNTVDYTYYRDGLLKHKIERSASGDLVAEHTIGYNANGHRVRDAVAKMNADDHAELLEYVKTYAYTPRNRVASVTKKTPGGSVLESYVYDANANIISQTIEGQTTTYDYVRNRLASATTSGTTASYNYDPVLAVGSTRRGQVIALGRLPASETRP